MKHLEIERKFLVDKEKWTRAVKPAGVAYIQGYLSIDENKVVRARIAGEKGFLTIKGSSENLSRPEFEYAIPAEEALELIHQFAEHLVEKVRTRIPVDDLVWEVDEFHGENEGLLLAEIELDSEEQLFEKPLWVGEEVTGDMRYYNSYLSVNPFRSWNKKTPDRLKTGE